ncbi:hypothetical protein [Kitasatospora sp. MBT66]|uniref:hypothetical protein n=1 Tax=Kitasatospora sp. MBT66 TaxID=1444769 RepID=UPI0005BA0F74|nr:hypothetical protein [Kitasatospora sp. MBT66]
MPVRFIGIDPNTGGGGSPSVFLDEEQRELLIQGWDLPPEKLALLGSTEWVAGHAVGIPPGENVVRIPLRMISILRKACDDAERAGLC